MADGANDQTLRELISSLNWSPRYPRNVFGGDIHEHTLKALEEQLDIRSKELFCKDQKAAVAFFELRRNSEGRVKSFRRVSVELMRMVVQDTRRTF